MPEPAEQQGQLSTPAEITIRLVQDTQPALETSLRELFTAAAHHTAEPQQRAAHAARLLGRGGSVTLEAERGAWSRYRVAVRVRGIPVTIATVELTDPQ